MIRAVIIDDERNSQDIIRLILQRYRPDVEILGCGDSCSSAISLIGQYRPDLVFLDLEMSDGTGFDVLTSLENLDFELIFITAHEKRFLQAIRFAEIEVILKPVDKEILCEAMVRASLRIENRAETGRYRILLENVREGGRYQIVLPTLEDLQSVSLDDIIWLEQGDESTLFHLNGKSSVSAQRPFRYYTELFGSLRFFQVTNSRMINLRFLKRPLTPGNALFLVDGTLLEISPRKKNELQEFLKNESTL